MSNINQIDWDLLASEVANSGFFEKEVTWKRCVNTINRYNEDKFGTVDVTLHTLSNYNYMRSWPVNVYMESGTVDRQSVQLIFLKKEFSDLGLLTPSGYLELDPERDRFVIDGLFYKSSGDTPVSQGGQNDILISIIVKREDTPTGTFR